MSKNNTYKEPDSFDKFLEGESFLKYDKIDPLLADRILKKKDNYHIFDFIYMLIKLVFLTFFWFTSRLIGICISIAIYLYIWLFMDPNLWIRLYSFFGKKGNFIHLYISNEIAQIPCHIIYWLVCLFVLVSVCVLLPAMPIAGAENIFKFCRERKIDCRNNILYAIETILKKPHKKRMPGAHLVFYRGLKKAEREKPFLFGGSTERWLKANRYGKYENYIDEDEADTNDSVIETAEQTRLSEALMFYGFRDLNFTADQLSKQYKKLLLKYHPDNNPDEDTTEMSQLVSEYYNLLKEVKGN
jgi:hypothetical protein